MLYVQVLFYTESLLLLSYRYLQLIQDICRTGLVLGTSSQFVILLVYNFSSCILGIILLDYWHYCCWMQHFICPSFKCSPFHPLLKLPQSVCCKVRNRVTYPQKTTH